MFEPYVVALKTTLPRYDERFRGYGMNKIGHLYEVAASGAEFVVLPCVYVTAREHARSHSYKRVFGTHRDPAHSVRIALLWGSFKRHIRDKYGDAAVLRPSLHPAAPALLPPPPSYCCSPMQEGKEDSGALLRGANSAESAGACKWLFYPSTRRKPVRIAGNLQRPAQTVLHVAS